MSEHNNDIEYLITTLGTFLIVALVCCICCFCMKISDMKLRNYILELAKKRNINVDLEKLKPTNTTCQSPYANENCTIVIPDVAIVL
ncbi:unnamed protein product [Pieris brassicae]|uniref:Uncharacterized protein n=1 Tax=Pieris brassicae TaxID=7116 RepID=A0A9P0TNX2_PIEBR|nr:unnamed protein product [Pieris brassicae]